MAATITGPCTVRWHGLPSGEGHGAGGEMEQMGSKNKILVTWQRRDHSAECPYERLCGSACRTAAEDYTTNSWITLSFLKSSFSICSCHYQSSYQREAAYLSMSDGHFRKAYLLGLRNGTCSGMQQFLLSPILVVLHVHTNASFVPLCAFFWI